jgi:hypothetical protein
VFASLLALACTLLLVRMRLLPLSLILDCRAFRLRRSVLRWG